MFLREAIFIAFGIASVAACAPMEQAPLVYASGVKVGVYAGTGASKTSPEVSIGVDQDDAALVPVAVAKHCDAKRQSSQECINSIYKMQIINGNNKFSNGSPPTIGALQTAVKDYNAAYGAVNIKKQDADSKSTALESVKGATGTPQATIDADQSASDAANAALRDAQTVLNVRQQTLIDVATGNSGTSTDTSGEAKRDALSVYGTFSNNSTAGGGTGDKSSGGDKTNPSAGVVIGKTFSTGIAAQFLTEGVRESAKTAAMASCLSTASAAAASANDTDKAAVLNTMIGLCGATQK